MKDPRVENFLKRGQWQYEYVPKVLFTEIDIKKSKENPARMGRQIDEERYLQYALKMESGEEFPAIVLLRFPDSNHLVATGMHRLEAAQLVPNCISIDAYLVSEPDIYRQETLVRQLNSIEGVGISIQEQIKQVIEIHARFPKISLQTLSKDWGLKHKQVLLANRVNTVRQRARNANYALSEKISGARVDRIGSVQNENVFSKLVEFIFNHQPANNVLDDLLQDIKNSNTEKTALDAIVACKEAEAARALKQKARHGRNSPGAANKVIGEARRFNNQVSKGLEHLFLSSLSSTDQTKAAIVFEEVIHNAKRLLDELARISSFSVPATPEPRAQLAASSLRKATGRPVAPAE